MNGKLTLTISLPNRLKNTYRNALHRDMSVKCNLGTAFSIFQLKNKEKKKEKKNV